jgi:imidazolonepropionase
VFWRLDIGIFVQMTFYYNIGRVITPLGSSAKFGAAMSDVSDKVGQAFIVDNGVFAAVGDEASLLNNLPNDVERINCRGLVALPGFVDSHTHGVFMGERSDEFCMRASGRSYQEIAAMGGGIRSTVSKVRGASAKEIAEHSAKTVSNALSLGTTTMEIKSGYGLSLESEIALLEAAEIVGNMTGMEVVRTWLGGHAVPAEKSQADYVRELIDVQLPEVVKRGLAEFADVFCDEGYFTNEETKEICVAAKDAGLKIRLHADELADTDGAALAAELGSFSADHLLKINDGGIAALAKSKKTIATLLPITALCIRSPFAPARKMIAENCAVAIATDCNPGSSMSENMQLAISLAVIGMGMTAEEAFTAATLNGAASIDRADRLGSIEPGKQADFLLFDIPSLAYLPYHIGVSDIAAVVKKGNVVSGSI